MAWLAEQEGDLKRELEQAEMKLYKFKKDRNLLAVSLDDKQSMLSANLASVNGKLTDLRIRILELDSKRKIIEHARTNIAEEETIPEIREKDTIRALRDAFIQLVEGERRPVEQIRTGASEDQGAGQPDGDDAQDLRRRRSTACSRRSRRRTARSSTTSAACGP